MAARNPKSADDAYPTRTHAWHTAISLLCITQLSYQASVNRGLTPLAMQLNLIHRTVHTLEISQENVLPRVSTVVPATTSLESPKLLIGWPIEIDLSCEITVP